MDAETGWCTICSRERDVRFHEWIISEAEAILSGKALESIKKHTSRSGPQRREEKKPSGHVEKLYRIAVFKLDSGEMLRKYNRTQKTANRRCAAAGIERPRGGDMSFDVRFERALRDISEARVAHGLPGKTAYPVAKEDFERW